MTRPTTEKQSRQSGQRWKTRSNEEWLAALQGSGVRQQAAIEDLRDYVVRVIYIYLSRHRSDLAHLDHSEVEQLAEDYAQETLVHTLKKLDTFRGDSKFTTWAYRIAINQAASDLRRKRWGDVSIDAMQEAADAPLPPLLASLEDGATANPDQRVIRDQIWTLIREVIENEFTDRQRIVFVNQYFHGVSPEVLADKLSTNRNNIYKVSHDARVKLKKRLANQNLTKDIILAAFQESTGPTRMPEDVV